MTVLTFDGGITDASNDIDFGYTLGGCHDHRGNSVGHEYKA